MNYEKYVPVDTVVRISKANIKTINNIKTKVNPPTNVIKLRSNK